MGPGGISIWQLLIILVIVMLLFGTKKLRGMGSDLGSAIKGFRKSVKDGGEEESAEESGPAEAIESKSDDASAPATASKGDDASAPAATAQKEGEERKEQAT